MSNAATPTIPVSMSRVRARSSRRILDAARRLLEADGLDQLSMRRLAAEADVSVRTIYNLFGDRDGLVTALVQESFDAMEAAVADINAEDPIERVWEAVRISVEANCRHVPKSVVAAVVADAATHRRLGTTWPGRALIIEAIGSATRSGTLGDELSTPILVEQAGTVFIHLLGRWAAGEIDEQVLTAGVLHAFDVCLLSVARPRQGVRARLLAHAAQLEPLLAVAPSTPSSKRLVAR